VGIRLAAVGEVKTVAVSAETITITITLAPGAVAMAAQSRGDESSQGDTELKNVYNGLKNTPGYPSNFRSIQNGTTRNSISRKDLSYFPHIAKLISYQFQIRLNQGKPQAISPPLEAR
jgi:hypothetical protein